MLMLFHNRRFRFVWLMTICDEAGLLVYFTVQGWLALMLTDSPFWVGATAAMNGLALMSFGLLAGVLADRVDRRLILTVSMTVQAVVAFTTAILIFTDLIELWHLLLIAFLRGSAGAVKLPSRFAIVLDVVERRELLQATAINFVGMSITGIIIPTVAGLVVQSTDIAWAYVIMGIAWALGPVTLIGLKGLRVVKEASSSPLQDFKQGVRYASEYLPIIYYNIGNNLYKENMNELAFGMYSKALGKSRANGMNAFKSILKAGVPLAFGSDGIPLSPLYGIASAMNHPDSNERLTFKEALHAYTQGSAYACRIEDQLGMIEPGMLADLVVLNRDPTNLPPDEVAEISIDSVFVDGKLDYYKLDNRLPKLKRYPK